QMVLSVKEAELTIAKCVQAQPIVNYEKEVGIKSIISAIRTAILNTAPAFKFSEKMDQGTATLLAADIYSAFKYETFEDILLMLKMARNGMLGSGKGQFDHDIVFNVFIPAYLQQKSEQREQNYNAEVAKRNRTEKMAVDKSILSENVKKMDELIKRLAKEKRMKKEKESPNEFVDHHAEFIKRLPGVVGKMTVEELKSEMV